MTISRRAVELLPDAFVDLLIVDPPYNLTKDFRSTRFRTMTNEEYIAYLDSWFPLLLRLLKPHATVYLCGDWRCSAAEYLVMSRYLTVRNRIVWQREKGRGALSNWKKLLRGHLVRNGRRNLLFQTWSP